LHESLDALRSLVVERHIRPVHKLPAGHDTTLFFLGTDPAEMTVLTEDEFKALERFMFEGGRIVVSFYPSNTKPWGLRRRDAKDAKKQQSSNKGGKKSDEEKDKSIPPGKQSPLNKDDDWPGMKLISLKERWDIEFAYADLSKDEEGKYQSVVARRVGGMELPEEITWHTALYFDEPATDWQVIYTREEWAALVERKFGDGSLVLSADSWFLSNEAMRKERHPELLAWLVGGSRTVLFDETHLGVMADPGIAALIRKYRLHGLVIGLVLLGGLFVWKNAVSFVPPHAEEPVSGPGPLVVGKESAAGFVNLLRRSIRPAELLSVCFAEWKKSCAHGRSDLAAKAERMAAIVGEEQGRPARERNPVSAYRRACEILSR
jgi:hypothetical protein